MTITRIEVAFGRKVRDRDGKLVGRLEEVHADWRGDECIVTHYVIARRGSFLLRELGMKKSHDTIIVPWDRFDLRDATRPRVTCSRDEL